MTEEQRSKIRQARLRHLDGHPEVRERLRNHSPEVLEKIRQAAIGRKHTQETILRMRVAQKGHPVSLETRRKQSEALMGHEITPEMREKLRQTSILQWTRPEMQGANKAERNGQWRGGTSTLRTKIRNLPQHKAWSQAVFTRDNFTCQRCGNRGGRLAAHHRKHFSAILDAYSITTIEQAIACEALWDVANEITYCREDHKAVHQEERENARLAA